MSMIAPRCPRCRAEKCWKAAEAEERAAGPRRACVLCPGEQPCDVADGYLVDSRCKGNLYAALGDLIDYYALTERELMPGAGTSRSSRGVDRPIGVRLTALNALAGHDLLGKLGSWEQDWRETFEHAPPPRRAQLDPWGAGVRTMPVPASLTEIVGYLLTWLDRACREHPAIDEFAREVRDLHHTMRVAARVTEPTTYRVSCPADSPSGDCGAMLRVSPDLDERVHCRQCGTDWTTRRLLLVAAHDSTSEIWLDLSAMAEMTGLAERTLQRWAQQGLVQRQAGRYSLASVQAARMKAMA